MTGPPPLRILLQTVGTGGPDNPVWEALAFAIRERRPDHVVFIVSAATADTTRLRVLDVLAQDGLTGFRHEPMLVEDPDDAVALAMAIGRRMEALRVEHPDAVIECDFTSGTKAMSAALLAAGVAHEVHRVLYATGPRDATGRATRTDGVAVLSPATLVAERRLAEAARLFGLGEYRGAFEVAHRLGDIDDEPLHLRSWALQTLALVCERWDAFEWGAADQLLPSPRRESRWQRLQLDGEVRRVREHLELASRSRVEEGSEWLLPRLADLEQNAARCADRGRFADAVMRCYRVVEYAVQVEVSLELRPYAGAVENGRIPRSVLERLQRERRIPAAGELLNADRRDPVRVGQQWLAELLKQLGNAVGERCYTPDRKVGLGALLEARNQSFLAHGQAPVAEATYKALHAHVQEVLALFARRRGLDLDAVRTRAQMPRLPWA